MTYNALQTKWLRHHFAKWHRDYGWSPAEFAAKTRQPATALSEALGVPIEEFEPPKLPPAPLAPAPPASIAALPDPNMASVVIEPGVELLPREKPAPAPPAPNPPSLRPMMGHVLLSVGQHVVDGTSVEVPGDPCTFVWWPLSCGKHVIDSKVVQVFAPAGIPINPSGFVATINPAVDEG